MNTAPVSDVVTSAPVPPTVALARVVEPLPERDALSLTETLGPMFEYLDASAAEARLLTVRSEDDTGKMKRARVLRLELKNKRVELDKRRKDLKSDILAKGKAIDAAFNLFEGLVKPLESHLLEQETFAERAIKARQDALRDARAEALRALGVVALPAALGEITEEAWALVIEDAKVAKETRERIAREQEEARVEAERILAEKRAAAAKAAKERAEAERVAAVGRHRREVLVALGVDPELLGAGIATLSEEEWTEMRATAQKAADEKREAERAEAARLVEAARAENRETARLAAEERTAKERAEAELATRREADEAKRREADQAKARELLLSDKERLLGMAELIRTANLPSMESPRGQEVVDKVRARLVKLAADVVAAAGQIEANR